MLEFFYIQLCNLVNELNFLLKLLTFSPSKFQDYLNNSLFINKDYLAIHSLLQSVQLNFSCNFDCCRFI